MRETKAGREEGDLAKPPRPLPLLMSEKKESCNLQRGGGAESRPVIKLQERGGEDKESVASATSRSKNGRTDGRTDEVQSIVRRYIEKANGATRASCEIQAPKRRCRHPCLRPVRSESTEITRSDPEL